MYLLFLPSVDNSAGYSNVNVCPLYGTLCRRCYFPSTRTQR